PAVRCETRGESVSYNSYPGICLCSGCARPLVGKPKGLRGAHLRACVGDRKPYGRTVVLVTGAVATSCCARHFLVRGALRASRLAWGVRLCIAAATASCDRP